MLKQTQTHETGLPVSRRKWKGTSDVAGLAHSGYTRSDCRCSFNTHRGPQSADDAQIHRQRRVWRRCTFRRQWLCGDGYPVSLRDRRHLDSAVLFALPATTATPKKCISNGRPIRPLCVVCHESHSASVVQYTAAPLHPCGCIHQLRHIDRRDRHAAVPHGKKARLVEVTRTTQLPVYKSTYKASA
jgi:hypothetical protein